MVNQEATRYFSDRQEKRVAKLLGGKQTSNSGAGKWLKGDVVVEGASLMVECKTQVELKDSFRIKKEWLEKNLTEAKQSHYLSGCLAFNFGPDQENYFIINEKLMTYLVENLMEDNR